MKTVLRAVCLLLCLGFMNTATAAMAQDDDSQDLYSATRGRYIQQQLGTTMVNINARRDKYLDQTKNTADFWHGVWQKHQPYSRGVTYNVNPAETNVPPEPGAANSSGYGRNITELIYGKNTPDGRSAADAVGANVPSANILADEANLNGSTPGQVSDRETKPVVNDDIKNMLPTR